MKISKRHIISLLIISIIALGAISVASAYTGTGFTHNVPSSKYYDLSASDILNKYSDTDCKVEETGVCTEVIDGDTIYLDNGKKVRFVGVNTPVKTFSKVDFPLPFLPIIPTVWPGFIFVLSAP